MTKLKQFIDDNNIDIKDMAYKTDITQASFYGWMSGRRQPKVKSLHLFRKYLKEKGIEVDVINLFV